MRRLKILLVGPFPPTTGGVTTFMLNLIKSAPTDEFSFVPFTTSRPPKKNVIDNWGNAALLRGGPVRIASGIAITLWHLIKYPFALMAHGCDMVQVQASDFLTFWESAIYAVVAGALGRPVLFRIGGAFEQFYRGSPQFIKTMILKTLHVPDVIIVQSESVKNLIQSLGTSTRLVVLPNWVLRECIRPRVEGGSARPVFLFVAGSEARRKGVDEMLRAAELLDQEGSPAQFHILAATPLLHERIRALNIGNVLSVEGFVSHDRVLDTMRQSDVFLLPSHGEGFPNSLVEAMACGLPSVVTPVNSVPDIVKDGGALTVPVGDAVALAKAISELALDRSLRQRLGREAKANFQRRFTAEQVLPPLLETYRELVARRAQPRRAENPTCAEG